MTYQFAHCTYEEEWTRDDLWFMSCHGTVKNLDGKIIKSFHFRTDINPKGETTAQCCRRWAKFYCPPGATMAEVMAVLSKSYSEEYLNNQLAVAMRQYDFFKHDRPVGYPGREGLAKFPHMRRWWRDRWREARAVRRWWRAMALNQPQLLLFTVTGFDYLYDSPYKLAG